jgi:hypothetical protein
MRRINFCIAHVAPVVEQCLDDFPAALGAETPIGGEADQQEFAGRAGQRLRQIGRLDITIRRMLDRAGPSGAGQDVVDAGLADVNGDAGDDVVVIADASATADAGMVMADDSAVLEDAMQALRCA